MSRRLLVRVAVLSLLAALTLAGCGDGDTTASSPVATATAGDDSAGVMAAAIRRLISRDHTFGQGTHRFSEYLIQERTDRTAGAPAGGDAPPSRPLTAAERAAIAEVVAPFGPFRFVADAGAWRTDDLQPRIAGSVILGVGEPEITGDRALAPVSLWCGGLCGTWLTYRVVRAGDAWRVTGIEGPVAIS